MVMLHEGLGCVALWRDFPQKLAAATGHGVFAYSRAGYGGSERIPLPRPLDYMSREARISLPAVLDAIGFRRGILLGHSDGASIAAIYAGETADERIEGLVLMAPHLFTEAPGLASIAEARRAYETGRSPLKARQISRRRRHRLPRLERRLARSRLQSLEHRGCGRPLARSRAGHPGRRRPIRNARTGPGDRAPVARSRNEPRSRSLPPFAADRPAAGGARGDRPLLRPRPPAARDVNKRA